MEPRLISLVNNCLGIAVEQGVSGTNPVLVKLSNTLLVGETIIVCAFSEPQLVLPLNVTWIVADPGHADYAKAFIRSSKTPDGGLQNTWLELELYADVFVGQYYAPEDHPIPSIISGIGGQLQGALLARILAEGASYSATELIPKQYVDGRISTLNSSFFVMYSNLNRRVTSNDQRIRALELGAVTVDQRLDTLESMTIGGMPTHIHIQETPEEDWVITHELGTNNVKVDIWDADNELVIPARVYAYNETTIIISFADGHPVAGRAIIVGVA